MKREAYGTLAEAEKRAADIAADFAAEGEQGLAMPLQLRAMAFQGENLLQPFGKTVLDACIFYRDYLAQEEEKEASALIPLLADQWHDFKKDPKHKLKDSTIKGIRQTANLLKKIFPTTRVKALTKDDAGHFIYSLNGDYQQEGTRARSSQFYNWCIKEGFATFNPFDAELIPVALPEADIEIFTAKRAEHIMALCESNHTEILVYVAVCLFAGLRPGEAELLTWENIHIDERQIHVLGTTSKSKVTHNVDIEDNLADWLKLYRPTNAQGLICPKGKTLARRRQKLHAALGYKAAGENEDAEEIVQDIMRHSYASYWQSKYQLIFKLCDMMANSPDVVREHYRKVVSKKEIAAYWSIVPKVVAEERARKAEAERKEREALEALVDEGNQDVRVVSDDKEAEEAFAFAPWN